MAVNRKAITRELCKRRFYHFFKRAWHILEPARPLVDNWHLEYLCNVAEDEVRRIAEGRKKEHDYLVNMPFRSAKSMIFSVMLQPWAWIEYPWLRFTTVSYSAPLALSHSNKSQKLMRSDWYQEHFGDSFNLKSDIGGHSKLKETETYFENDRGGYRFVSSVTGGSTGYGGDINIADDILKAQEADSEASRDKSNTFWSETYRSRVSDFDSSVFFLIMQRLHDNDPTGYSLQKQEEAGEDRYFWINLPARDNGKIHPKPLQRYYQDGLFFPERFSHEVIAKLESPAGIGIKAANAQLHQDPVKPGGNLFQEGWFVKIPRGAMPKRRQYDKIIRAWDTAFTDDEKNSALAFVELGLYEGRVYVINYGYEWLEFPDQIKFMEASPMDVLHKVEDKASGKSSVQTLKRAGVPARAVPIEAKDKRARGNAISIHIEGGLVCVPEYLWNGFMNDSRQGILKFPEGTHDDLGDAFVLGITDLLGIPRNLDRDQLDSILEEESGHIFNS